MDKLIRDGKVAVLVSGEYGAGWYSWNHKEQMLFDPVIAQMLLDGVDTDLIFKEAKGRYPDVYLGSVDGLDVEWIDVGTEFHIYEYDGSETLMKKSDYNWKVA